MQKSLVIAVISFITLIFVNIAFSTELNLTNTVFKDPMTRTFFYIPPPVQLVGTAANNITVKNSIIVKRLLGVASAELLFEISNSGYKDHALVKVICPIAKEIQFQNIKKDQYQALSLVKIKQIPLLGREDLNLQPNGYHIMLINLKKPIQIGDLIPATLLFDDGSKINVLAEISL